MNKNTAGALLLATIAAAGFTWDRPEAVWLAGITCALTFLASECWEAAEHFGNWQRMWLDLSKWLAIGSWATTALAALCLLF